MKHKRLKGFLGILLSFMLVLSVGTAANADTSTVSAGSEKPIKVPLINYRSTNSAIKQSGAPPAGATPRKADTISKPAGGESELDAYIADMNRSLATPLGATGFDESGADDTVTVIVTFQTLPLKLSKGATLESYEASHAAFMAELASKGISAKVIYDYFYVFNGCALETQSRYIDDIAAISGVYAVSPNYEVTISETDEVEYFATTKSPAGMLESRQIYNSEELARNGFTGSGVKVGVIDTGIDYNHPDLFPVFKGGWDFVNGDSDPMETTYKDWQSSGKSEKDGSSTYYTSHGTHVSGIIAGQGVNAGVSTLGLAPGVELYVYKVLGPYSRGDSYDVLAGIDRSAADGCQVVNMSLGYDHDTAYAPEIVAVNNASMTGTLYVISAGNNATYSRNANSLGVPSTAYLALSVAATEYGGKALRSFPTATVGTAKLPFAMNLVGNDLATEYGDDYLGDCSFTAGRGYQYFLVLGTGSVAGDIKPTTVSNLAAVDPTDVAGKIAVVARGRDAGSATFTEMYDYLVVAKGASALLIVNDVESYLSDSTSLTGEARGRKTVLSCTLSNGDALIASMADPFILPSTLVLEHQRTALAYFSSIGPVTETYGIKPDITASGWQVLSTFPAYIDTFDHNATDYTYAVARQNGTSMAAPHVTALAALAIQAFPSASIAEIKARLMNTADPTIITSYLSGFAQASVFEIGAGLIDASRAILQDNGSYFTVTDDIPAGTPDRAILAAQSLSSLNFGVVDYILGYSSQLPVTVHNTSGSSKTYTFGSMVNTNTKFSLNGADYALRLTFSASSVTVPAGGTATVDVNMEFTGAPASGLLEGYMVITEGSNTYHMPFAGSLGTDSLFSMEDMLVDKPVVTKQAYVSPTTAGAYSSLSNTSAVCVSWSGPWPTGEMHFLILDKADSSKILGASPNFFSGLTLGPGAADYDIFLDALTPQYYPMTPSGTFGATLVDIPEGIYGVGVADATWMYYDSDAFYMVDNTIPTVTPTDWNIVKAPSGATMIEWKLKVQDKGIDDAIAFGLYDELDGYAINYEVCLVTFLDPVSLAEVEWRYADAAGNVSFSTPVDPAYELPPYPAINHDYLAFVSEAECWPFYDAGGGSIGFTWASNNKTGAVRPSYSLMAELVSMTPNNGTLTGTLNPNIGLVDIGDFTVQYTFGSSTIADLTITSFSYNPLTGIATFNFVPFTSTTDKILTIYLTYNGKTLSGTVNVVGSPKTGDDSNPFLWLLVAGAALAAAGGVYFLVIRKRKDSDRA